MEFIYNQIIIFHKHKDINELRELSTINNKFK